MRTGVLIISMSNSALGAKQAPFTDVDCEGLTTEGLTPARLQSAAWAWDPAEPATVEDVVEDDVVDDDEVVDDEVVEDEVVDVGKVMSTGKELEVVVDDDVLVGTVEVVEDEVDDDVLVGTVDVVDDDVVVDEVVDDEVVEDEEVVGSDVVVDEDVVEEDEVVVVVDDGVGPVTATLWSSPAATAATSLSPGTRMGVDELVVVPSPSWPLTFLPHDRTVPSDRRLRL